MKSVAHLLDDTNVGGITRMLADQALGLCGTYAVRQHRVDPRQPLPPKFSEHVLVIHFTASWSKLPFLTLLRAQHSDVPIVLVEHTYTRSFEARCVPGRKRFRAMLRLVYKLADVVVAVSNGQAQWMLEAGLLPEEKLIIIQPSVDSTQLEALPLPHREHNAPLKLAAYGRYCEQKGFDILLEAMNMLPEGSAELRLAGYGPDQEKLRLRAATIPGVRVEDAIRALPDFLADCHAVIIPSRWEAFGIVALEARASGRPIITSRVDGLTEQAVASEGAVSSPGVASELADAILALARKDLAQRGAVARQSAAMHYSRHLQSWSQLLTRATRRDAKRQSLRPTASETTLASQPAPGLQQS